VEFDKKERELTSRYRYAAVSNHADGTGPLAAYFHGDMMNLPGASASIFDRNKFLAEDRILAFGTLILPSFIYLLFSLLHLLFVSILAVAATSFRPD
jgi:hypothetical protein